jgi:HSP20 family protein
MTKENATKKHEKAETTGVEKAKTLAKRSETLAPTFPLSPFAFMRRFAEDMERLFSEFGYVPRFSPIYSLFDKERWTHFPEFTRTMWSPQIEVVERDNQFVVRADLPGMKKEDVKIEITDDALTLKGERKHEEKEEREGYYRSERSYGSFYRQIPLPKGAKTEEANAVFKDGVLEITMACPGLKAVPRTLEIKAGEEPAKVKAAHK